MSRPRTVEPRCKQLNLSLTERELASIEDRATALGMRAVHFSRALLLDKHPAPKAPTQPHERRSNFDRLVHMQLVRLGNLLNQAVRQVHRFGGPMPADLEPLLADIRSMIARIRP